MGILLNDIFDPQLILLNMESRTKEDVFTELAGAISAVHPECDSEIMLSALWEREKKMSTGITPGVAIPHIMYRGIENMVGAIGVSQTGIDYDALDQKPVYVVFMLAMGLPTVEDHLRALNKISRLVKSESLTQIRNATNNRDVNTILSRFQ